MFAGDDAMRIIRVIPMLTVDSLEECLTFYRGALGLEVVTRLSWIATLCSGDRVDKQLGLITRDPLAPCNADVSVQVCDVDGAYASAMDHGIEIVYPLSDEPWGARRFFLRDEGGSVINVLAPI